MIGLAAAGLLAHTAYLWQLARAEISKGALFSNWVMGAIRPVQPEFIATRPNDINRRDLKGLPRRH